METQNGYSDIPDLIAAGREAAKNLFFPIHRGTIPIGDDRYMVWSWETMTPHLKDMDDMLRGLHYFEGGNIKDKLGVWIMSSPVDPVWVQRCAVWTGNPTPEHLLNR